MGARNAISTLCNRCQRPLRTRLPHGDLAAVRTFHGARYYQEHKTPQYAPRDLGDFYNDLLATPLPKVAKATTKTELPEWVASGGRKEIEERAKKVFGSIEGSGYQSSVSRTPDSTWKTINGVPIPPRPLEPDNCCMSGCVHCVWDDYRDDVESWAARLKEAQAKAQGKGVTKTPKVGFPRSEVNAASSSMDDDGGGSEALWQAPSGEADPDALFQDIPIGIREFMANEKRIRERKKARNKDKQKREAS